MSAVATTPAEVEHSTSPLVRLPWKASIGLGIFAVLAVVLLIVFGRDGKTVFEFTANGGSAIAPLTIPARPVDIVIAIVAVVLAVVSAVLTRRQIKTPFWYIAIFALFIITGFLIWASAGNSNPFYITALLVGTVGASTPYIFGSLGGVISERVGVTNIAIEGQLLAGAFVSALTATATHSAIAGIIAAAAAGVLVSFVLGAFTIKYWVNQVIVGVVLNFLVIGLTTFVYQQVLTTNTALNSFPALQNFNIPLLSAIPIIGPVLFGQNVIVYLMYVAVVLVTIGLYRTRWGLRLRSVGEHPQAADTVGINVGRTRFWNVALAGAIVGIGGSWFTLGDVGPFDANITNGAGYIALAAVIFGGWHPIRAMFAALLFGFCTDLQSAFSTSGSAVPNDFLLMLPYVVTILAVAGFVGRVRPPAAAGKPYIKS
ncbi:MAG TPA: ABC transporter permease [Galbitalea sp.]|jgi:simple sugar transport system permease protein|nr:ABC transporter permease [Galbitalea sp.]